MLDGLTDPPPNRGAAEELDPLGTSARSAPDLGARATNAVVWSGVQSWGRRLASILTFVVLARLLEPRDFGLVAFATVFTYFLGVAQDAGFTKALVQLRSIDSRTLHTAFWFGLSTSTGLFLIVQLVADPVSGLVGEPRLEAILRLSAAALPISAVGGVPTALLMRRLDFRTLAKRTIGASVCSGVVAAGLAALGAGAWALVAQMLASAAVQSAVVWSATSWRPAWDFSRASLRDLLGLSLNFLGLDILAATNRRSDDFLIGGVLGPVALGFYSVAYNVFLTLSELFVNSVANVSRSLFPRLQTEPSRLRRTVYTATRLTATVAVPAFVGMSLVAPDLVVVVFGDQWQASGPVLRAIALLGIFHMLLASTDSAIIAAGYASWSLRLRLVSAVGRVVFYGAAIAMGAGIVGVAVSAVLWNALFYPVMLRALRAAIGVSYRRFLGELAAPLTATAVMAVAVTAVGLALGDQAPAARLLGQVAAGVATYTAVLVALTPGHVREAAVLVRRAVASRA